MLLLASARSGPDANGDLVRKEARTVLKIGNMLWRIGRLLDVNRQIAWTQQAGFDGVGFHASAGAPGQ